MPRTHEDWRSRHAEPLALAAAKEQWVIEREPKKGIPECGAVLPPDAPSGFRPVRPAFVSLKFSPIPLQGFRPASTGPVILARAARYPHTYAWPAIGF